MFVCEILSIIKPLQSTPLLNRKIWHSCKKSKFLSIYFTIEVKVNSLY